MYRLLATFIFTVMMSSETSPKCANKYIYISGRIVGPTDSQFKVGVQTTPDANWEPQPAITLKEGTFEGKVYFDSTKAEGTTRDDCSRVPEIVKVELSKEGRQIDFVQLDVSKDFVKNKMGDFKLRTPVLLHSQ